MRIYALPLRGSAVLLVAPLIINAAVEIGGSFVLIWAAMLQISGQYRAQYG
jgi:hypothetical protein